MTTARDEDEMTGADALMLWVAGIGGPVAPETMERLVELERRVTRMPEPTDAHPGADAGAGSSIRREYAEARSRWWRGLSAEARDAWGAEQGRRNELSRYLMRAAAANVSRQHPASADVLAAMGCGIPQSDAVRLLGGIA